jgi:hypothetical protein
MADKIDSAVRLAGAGPLVTPSLAVLLGRYVAYEAGSADRIDEGLAIMEALLSAAAKEEAKKLYGGKNVKS